MLERASPSGRVRCAPIVLWSVVVLFGALVATLLIPLPGGVSDGRITETLEFLVVDAATDMPISNAQVRIRDLHGAGRDFPSARGAPGERVTKGISGRDGLAQLTRDYRTSAHWGPWSSEEIVDISDDLLWLEVTAAGYETRLTPLAAVVGGRHALAEFPLPPLRVAIAKRCSGPDAP